MKNLLFKLAFAFAFVCAMSLMSCGEGTETQADDTEMQDGHDHMDHDSTGMRDGHMNNMNSEAGEMDMSGPEYTSAYVCPMHCKGSGSAEPGNCPVCQMAYVQNESHEGHQHP